MKIELMLIGCAKCKRLERNTQQAVQELGLDTEIVRIEDIEEIKRRGVLRAPVLFIDGEVKAVGIVLGVEEIKTLLLEAQAKGT